MYYDMQPDATIGIYIRRQSYLRVVFTHMSHIMKMRYIHFTGSVQIPDQQLSICKLNTFC